MTPEEKETLMSNVSSYLDESCESIIMDLESNIENRMLSFPQFYSGIPDNVKRACILSAKESYLASIAAFEQALKHALKN